MKNVKMAVDAATKTLTITVKLDENFGTSASGKSETVASTSGNKPIEGFPGLFIGVNVYKQK